MKRKFLKKVLSGILACVSALTICATGMLGTGTVAQAASSVSGVSTVSNMTSDFAKGVDISEVIALENSGAAYYYLDGTSGDIFDILKGDRKSTRLNSSHVF